MIQQQYLQLNNMIDSINRNVEKICQSKLNISSKTLPLQCNGSDQINIDSINLFGTSCTRSKYIPDIPPTYYPKCPLCTVYNGIDCTVIENATVDELIAINNMYKQNFTFGDPTKRPQMGQDPPMYTVPLPLEPTNTINNRKVQSTVKSTAQSITQSVAQPTVHSVIQSIVPIGITQSSLQPKNNIMLILCYMFIIIIIISIVIYFFINKNN